MGPSGIEGEGFESPGAGVGTVSLVGWEGM